MTVAVGDGDRPVGAGLHLTATARTASVEELDAVLGRASAAGMEILPLSMHSIPTRPGLVLGYGAIPTTRVTEGLRRLRRCFHD